MSGRGLEVQVVCDSALVLTSSSLVVSGMGGFMILARWSLAWMPCKGLVWWSDSISLVGLKATEKCLCSIWSFMKKNLIFKCRVCL